MKNEKLKKLKKITSIGCNQVCAPAQIEFFAVIFFCLGEFFSFVCVFEFKHFKTPVLICENLDKLYKEFQHHCLRCLNNLPVKCESKWLLLRPMKLGIGLE